MDAEIIGYIAGTLTTICFIPQAWKIIRNDNYEGVSLLMYVCYSLGVVCWLIYGICIESAPVITFNTIGLVLTLLINYKLIKARS